MPLPHEDPLFRNRVKQPETVAVTAYGADRNVILRLQTGEVGEPVTEETDEVGVTVHRKHATQPPRVTVGIR